MRPRSKPAWTLIGSASSMPCGSFMTPSPSSRWSVLPRTRVCYRILPPVACRSVACARIRVSSSAKCPTSVSSGRSCRHHHAPPEEIVVFHGTGGAQLPISQHDVDGQEVVTSKATLADEPAHATTKRDASNARRGYDATGGGKV